MKITIIGTGYVGLVTGTCLSNMGHHVSCVDIDSKKIDKLNKGIIPIYEQGLEELVKKNVSEGRLFFTTSMEEPIKDSEVVFIAVGTPPKEDGKADLSYVVSVVEKVAENIDSYKVIVNKSTVPVGTAEMVKRVISENMKKKVEFDVVSNPEFLKEGMAVRDFLAPDRIVVGAESERAKGVMEEIYKDIARPTRPLVFTELKSAELIKYASNGMLATRISFMNQLSCLADEIGADIKEVAKGIGLDSRIGSRFLQAGIGFGGSCFPKDVRALSSSLKEYGCAAELMDSVRKVNERQKLVAVNKLESVLDIKGSTVAVWGVAFKPKTDDVRESPAISIIKELQRRGADVRAFDPIAMDNAKKVTEGVVFCDKAVEAVEGSDALIVATEWDEFRNPDFLKIKELMNNPVIVDGRNIYNPSRLKEIGFKYIGIGRQ